MHQSVNELFFNVLYFTAKIIMIINVSNKLHSLVIMLLMNIENTGTSYKNDSGMALLFFWPFISSLVAQTLHQRHTYQHRHHIIQNLHRKINVFGERGG